MKSVRDYIAQDMWGHILMTGPDIRGYFSGEKYPTVAEKKTTARESSPCIPI